MSRPVTRAAVWALALTLLITAAPLTAFPRGNDARPIPANATPAGGQAGAPMASGAAVTAPAPDPDKAALQRRLESGENLSSRAQRVLFRCRNQQDAGEHARAIEIVTSWFEGDPDRRDPLLLLTLATSQLAVDDPAGALASLRTAVELEPNFARAWLRLGEVAYGEGLYAEAAEAFARGQALTPAPDPALQYYVGAAWLQADEPERAVTAMTTLLDHHRQAAELDWYRILVAAVVQTDRPARALPYLDHLLADHPADPQAWELAYQHAANGEAFRQAAIYLTICGYLRPLAAAELERLGDLYVACNVPLSAARSYAQALRLRLAAPESTATVEAEPASRWIASYRRLASAWLAAHRPDEARAALQEGLNAYNAPDLWSLLGDLEYQAGNYDAALTAFGRGCDLDPTDGRGWLLMGYCAVELDDAAAARDHLQRATGFADQADAARRLLQRLD